MRWEQQVYKSAFNARSMANETVQKNDFVALRYSGTANDVLFDSNEEENVKKLHPDAKAEELVIAVGRGMVVPGLDKTLEGKEVGKRYEVVVSAREGFGERRREFVKTIPLHVFHEKNIQPYAGQTLLMDNTTARVLTVSGARVITDFNNPLAGKELRYSFVITRKVTDEKEKAEALFKVSFKLVPAFESEKEAIVVRGSAVLEAYVKAYEVLFKELLGKELRFVLEKKAEGEHEHEGRGKLEHAQRQVA